jgi:solute carrier family 12 (potassium/chloride transporter), member 4/6
MKNQAKNWGDGFTGLKQERAKRAMLGVHPKLVEHVKNWKPQLLVVDTLTEEGIPTHPALFSIADQLKKGNGLIIFAGIKVGEETQENFTKAKEARNNLHDYFFNKRMEVISKVVLTKKTRRGIKNVIQTAGLGVLEPNSLLIPWPDDLSQMESFEKVIVYAKKVGIATLCARPIELFDIKNEKLKGSIDIWWFYYDGGLMCLIAYLLKKHKVWKYCQARIFLVIPAEQAEVAVETLKTLKEWLRNYRMLTSVYTEIVEIPAVLLSGYVEQGKELIGQSASYDPFFYTLETSYEIPSDSREINTKILEFSKNSELIITVMPKRLKSQTPEDFLVYVNSVTKGIKRVIMVIPTKNSVVTDYN